MDKLKELKDLVDKKKQQLNELKNSACDINAIYKMEKELISLEREIKKEENEIKLVEEELNLNIAGKLARAFLKNPLTPVIALTLILMGLIAVLMTPRQENPTIDVPAANVIVMYPGASSKEVQNVIVEPLERTLQAMTGVKHVYGMAMGSVGIVTVRFKIGQDKVRSMSKLYDRIMQNMDKMPKGVMPPLVKPIVLDVVPSVTIALASKKYNAVILFL